MILNYISSSIRAVSEAKDSLASKLPDGLDSLYHNSPLSEHLHNQIHNNHEFISPDAGWFWDWSVSTTLALTIVLIVLFMGTWLVCQKFGKKISLKLGFWIAFILGIIVYDLGMCTGPIISLYTNIPMAVVHSLEMFAFNSDISAIHEPYHNSWQYMSLFSFVHALAATVSLVFIIDHFLYNITAKFKILWLRVLSWLGEWNCFNYACLNNKDLYLFWGVNEGSFLLAESIRKEEKEEPLIVFVRTNGEEEDPNDHHLSIDRILDFLSLRTSDIGKMRKLKCFTTSTNANLMSINFDADDHNYYDVLGKYLGLTTLRKIIKRSKGKLHILFLSDDEVYNLHAVTLLAKDKTILESAAERKQSDNVNRDIIFHCHARNNSVHRVIEDYNIKRGLDVKIVDTSKINIENVKRNPKLLPVEYVKVENDATVSSAFNALVVGFSEVGEESVRFLYEHGAFVKTGSTNDKVERSEFHIDVVDNKMRQLAGSFVANMRSIPVAIPYMGDVENKDTLITLHDMDCRSVKFYQKLDKWLDNLNYIVLATEDDELNISLGVRIMQLAVRKGLAVEKMCILVRVHKDEDGHIFEIARHYNRLWKAQKASTDNSYMQESVTTDVIEKFPLYLFGLDRKTYTYANIIEDKLLKQAIKYKEVYEACTNPQYVAPSEDKQRQKMWHKEYDTLMRLDEESKVRELYPTWSALKKIRRSRSQDMTNSLHSMTKLNLAAKALGYKNKPTEASKVINTSIISPPIRLILCDKFKGYKRYMNSTSYSRENGEMVVPELVRILDVLAQTEHLRWNASHEMLGFVYGLNLSNTEKDWMNYKDEIRMEHSCITSWQHLDEQTKSYDYNTVDLAIGIISKNHPLQAAPSDDEVE